MTALDVLSHSATAKTLLLVEDQPIVAMKQAQSLERHGYTVVHAHSEERALETVRTNAALDLVLMDLELADGPDGSECAKAILALRELPIVFLTHHTDHAYVSRARSVTNYGYVLKSAGEFVLVESVEMALRLFETYQHYRLLAENSNDTIAVYDASLRPIYLSPAFTQHTGFSPEDFAHRDVFELVHPDDAERLQEEAKRVIASGARTARYEFRVLDRDDHVYWVESYARYVYDDAGNLQHIIANERNITPRKQAEQELARSLEEKQRLMDELNHRVKNNLAMITSLLNLKDSALGDTADLSDIRSHVRAIASVHDLLGESGHVSHIPLRRYVSDLLASSFSIYTGPDVELEVDIPDIRIPTKTAVTLALILNELATNAMKHGFADEATPRFHVSLRRAESPETFLLTVSNSGKPFPEDVDIDRTNSLGMRLVRSLAAQIGGSLELQRRPHPVFRIRFSTPVAEGEAESPDRDPA